MACYNVLDLFSGIGGFSLGLERTGGFKTVAFCEIDPYCRAVLRKHWPEVPCFEDVRRLAAAHVDGIDVICGGFPCQDISQAGRRRGIYGQHSGLWAEFHRLIGALRPRYVIVENVAALLGRGIERVLGDLASIGYDAEWHCIPASAVGAPHRRDRVWIVVYPNMGGSHKHLSIGQGIGARLEASIKRIREDVENAECLGDRTESECNKVNGTQSFRPASGISGSGWWNTEPDVGRVAHGVPARVDRLKALGNAVVPQIVEIIGEAILEAENMK